MSSPLVIHGMGQAESPDDLRWLLALGYVGAGLIAAGALLLGAAGYRRESTAIFVTGALVGGVVSAARIYGGK